MRGATRLFWELVGLSIRRQFTYRAATFAGLLTNFFFGLLRAAVMVALYGARQEVEGISLAGAITFTGVSQATIAFLSLFSWFDLIRSVYTGQVGADLLKPMNYFMFWMAQDLGRALVNILLRGATIMIFYAMFFDITTPQTASQWLGLAAAICLAWMVGFAWRFLVNLASFWTPNAVGIARLFFSLSWFMSGFLMPLRFLPEWFQRLCYLTPFPYTVNVILETYLGVLSGPALVRALLGQAAWIVALVLAGRLVLRAGVRRLVIQGG
ncbi:MAG: ABC-2 family transporter protein [Chloroflexota bacterium]